MDLVAKADYLHARLGEPIRRRTFGRIFLGLAVSTAAAPLILRPHVAEAATAVDCATYMFHQESASAVDRVILANAADRRLPVSGTELVRILRDEIPAPGRRLFCLTFDDGYLGQYSSIVPLLERRGVRGTFFVLNPLSWWGDRVHRYVTPEQVREMAARGMDIGSHGTTHQNLVRARGSDSYWHDLLVSRTEIGEVLGEPPGVFCYPFGAHNAQVREDTYRAGYLGAFSTDSGTLPTSDLLYRVLRRRPA